ncbi:MAG: thioesterase family protein [Deinococcales bacterium]
MARAGNASFSDPTLQLRVRFAETDQMGVAHHSVYPVWMEAGRVEWMRGLGLSYIEVEADGISLAVSALELSYRAAAHFDDLITVATRLVTARSRLLRFEYHLVRASDDSLIATGATVHVPTDPSGRAMRLPAKWLEPFAALCRSGD